MFGTLQRASLKPWALDTKAPVKPTRARERVWGYSFSQCTPFPLKPLLVCRYTVTVVVPVERFLFFFSNPAPPFHYTCFYIHLTLYVTVFVSVCFGWRILSV
jgi:hypothetical protein